LTNVLLCALFPPMPDTITVPTAALHPDADRAELARISQFLALVRNLIAYGRHLHDTLEEHDLNPYVVPWFAFLVRLFGFDDINLILARLTRGLLRATRLEARLSKRAACGVDLKPIAFPPRSPRKPWGGKPTTLRASAPAILRAAKPAAVPPPRPAKDPADDRTVFEPVTTNIGGILRRRPLSAALLDICLDFGIVPALLVPTWQELGRDLTLYGSNPATLLSRWEERRHHLPLTLQEDDQGSGQAPAVSVALDLPRSSAIAAPPTINQPAAPNRAMPRASARCQGLSTVAFRVNSRPSVN
jgi:hypothetical protein